MLDWLSLFFGFIIGIVFVIFIFILEKKVEKIREFLINNKIFFETIVAVLLAIMAITLTINSNEIASYEIELKKMENQPLLKFDVNLSEYDYENYRFTKDQLIISNIGTPPKEFKIDNIIFLNIAYENEHGRFENALIPINNYYGLGSPTGNLIGKLVNFKDKYYYYYENHGNYEYISIANDEFTKFAVNKNSLGYINIMRIVKFEYKDIYEKSHEEMYYVDPYGYKTHKLTKNNENIVSDYYDDFQFYEFLDITELSPEILYEKYTENINGSKKVLLAIYEE